MEVLGLTSEDLSDILPTAYHSVMDTRVEEGDIVGVWGLGPIGQCVVRFALAKGASKVYAIDTVPSRLVMAQKAGANVVPIDFNAEDLVKKIQSEVPDGLNGEWGPLTWGGAGCCSRSLAVLG